jgi:hypothetical protein
MFCNRDAGRPPGGESGANPKVSNLPFTSTGKVESTRPKGELTENGFPVKRTDAAGRLHMRLFRDEKGQTMVLTALLMCCLMGFMALAIDVGVLFRAQRRLQTQADAGAIAGAISAYYGGTTWATVAKTASENNGMPSTDSYVTNNGPANGWHLGGEYYEVIITEPNPTPFMGTFGTLFGNPNLTSMNVAARAVAGIVPGQNCAVALNLTAADAVDLQGNADFEAPHCNVMINSKNQTALCTTGNKAKIVTDGLRIVGAQNRNPPCNQSQDNATTGVAPVDDPFAGTVFPDPTKVCNAGNTVSAATVTSATTILSSSLKDTNTGLTFNLTCFSAANVTLSGVTLGSSTTENNFYLFEHGLIIGGNDTVYGTMDLDSGNFCQGSIQGGGCKFTSGNTLSLYAPANTKTNSYAYNGMGFMVNPNAVNANAPQCDNSYKGTLPTVYPSLYPTGATGGCVQMQFGGNSANLDGIVYTPSDVLYLQDSGGTDQFSDLVANEIYDKSSTLILTDNYNLEHPYSPLNHVALVE